MDMLAEPMTILSQPLHDGDLTLTPVTAELFPALRACFAVDSEIWDIYPVNLNDPDAERQLKAFHGGEGWIHFAVIHCGEVVGTTSFIHPAPDDGTVMIGGTYLAPSVRGAGVNGRMKRLMINRAFALGFWRIELTVDTRNTRSMAACVKLGATLEGVLRKNRRTWTGYVRDTALYAILKEDWRG